MAATALELLRAQTRRDRTVRRPTEDKRDNGNVAAHTPAGRMSWDTEKALAYLQRAWDALAWAYPDGAWPWAARERPDLVAACHAAEAVAEEVFKAQDRIAFEAAVDALEATVRALCAGYKKWQSDTKKPAERPPAPPAAETTQLGLLEGADQRKTTHTEPPGRTRARR